jgi:hypothetical protein
MKALSIATLAVGLFLASCSKNDEMQPSGTTADGMRVTLISHDGTVDGTMRAFVDGQGSNYMYRMYTHQASAGMLQQGIANVIYTYPSTTLSHGEPEMKAVLSTMPMGNGLYREMNIVFQPGVTPMQFFKDEAVMEALSAHQISLVSTNTVYRITDASHHTGATAAR